MSERPDRCETCRFYDPDSDLEGRCKKRPPQLAEVRDGTLAAPIWMFPDTKPHEWCGEWESKPPTPEEMKE